MKNTKINKMKDIFFGHSLTKKLSVTFPRSCSGNAHIIEKKNNFRNPFNLTPGLSVGTHESQRL